jgi:hypothetical protein
VFPYQRPRAILRQHNEHAQRRVRRPLVVIPYRLILINPLRQKLMQASVVEHGRIPGEAYQTDAAPPYAGGYEFINRDPTVRKVLLLGQGLLPFFIDKGSRSASGNAADADPDE